MNYLHTFHAGNFADVFKHSLLVALLETLKTKPAPFCYMETHAGSGCYDLCGAEAQRTREFEQGILRLGSAKNSSPILQIYLDVVRKLNTDSNNVKFYPGSPLVAQALMREMDCAHLCELKESEAHKLKSLLHHDKRIHVHGRDGYAALKALLPPTPRRGLVLIDPPFEEQEDEFQIIQTALTEAKKRWPTGIYAIWYPIKLRQSIIPFYRWLKSSGFNKVLLTEFLLQPDNSPLRLNGCGMVIINTPWKFDNQLQLILPELNRRLANNKGFYKIEWLSSYS